MSDHLLSPESAASSTPQSPARTVRPPMVPEKFWDPASGSIRVEALLKSYLALERRLSARPAAVNALSTGIAPVADPGAVPGSSPADPVDTPPAAAETGFDPSQLDRDTLLRALGVPERADDYQVNCDHGLFQPDPTINQRLHQAGFTPDQVQLLYDLAAEHFVPAIQNLAGDYEAERQRQRLVEHFGGPDQWRELSRQLLAWGRQNLPPAALEGLSTTAEGVMALYRLMAGDEPVPLRGPGSSGRGLSEQQLHAQMRDPRYWRDRDPAVIAQVTEGFRRLYPDQA